MDDLQLLRATRNEVGTIPAATLARGRERLMRAAHEEATSEETSPSGPAARKGRRNFRRNLTLASAAAALLVGALVSTDVALPDQQVLNAEAAAVLEDAATASIRTADPVVLPGQYLNIETKALYETTSLTADGLEASWQKTRVEELYIPADITDEWVLNRGPYVPSESAPDIVKESARLLPIEEPETYSRLVGVFRGPAGAFSSGEQYTIIGESPTDTSDLPREPQALLNRIYEHTEGTGSAPDEEAFNLIAESLRSGVIPADLRAALYKAAALIPAVDVTDPRAALDGREGIALGRVSAGENFRDEIIIDPSSGLLIGERVVALKDAPGLPAGTVLSWTSVRTSVVDSAP
ncbi:RNA polymerase sigma-70 factor (ECF subfamily) [Arthrobacter sp. CAN_A212]|uniref:CU044_5270 family protein n=1 Tax=Arthrobacter sp. CAN_A212 TaxID=2787719 RepID=UPI0018CB59DF